MKTYNNKKQLKLKVNWPKPTQMITFVVRLQK